MGRLTDSSAKGAPKEAKGGGTGGAGTKKEASPKKGNDSGGGKKDSGSKESRPAKEAGGQRNDRAGSGRERGDRSSNKEVKTKEKTTEGRKEQTSPKSEKRGAKGPDQQRRDQASSGGSKELKNKSPPEKAVAPKAEKKTSSQPEKRQAASAEKTAGGTKTSGQALRCEAAAKAELSKGIKNIDYGRLQSECAGPSPKEGTEINIESRSPSGGSKAERGGVSVSYRDREGNSFEVLVVENSRGDQHSFTRATDGQSGRTDFYLDGHHVESTAEGKHDPRNIGVQMTPMSYSNDRQSILFAPFPSFDTYQSAPTSPGLSGAPDIPMTPAMPSTPSSDDRPERKPPYKEHSPKEDPLISGDTAAEIAEQFFHAKGKLDAKEILDRANGRWRAKSDSIARSKDLDNAIKQVSSKAKSGKAMKRMLKYADSAWVVGVLLDAKSVYDDVQAAPAGSKLKVGVASAGSEGVGILIGGGAGLVASGIAVGLSIPALPAIALTAAFSIGASYAYNDTTGLGAEDRQGRPQTASDEVQERFKDFYEEQSD